MSWTTRLPAVTATAVALTLSGLAASVALNGAVTAGATGIGWDGKPASAVSASSGPLGGIGWDDAGAPTVTVQGASFDDGIGWD
ncbi:hypothetical protein AB0P15_33220 [Streptomyces sp. NPDC087917]|uniref:hypothetical protein n=1 Tax=Streptomyces sp. NPDC087917 TaxID=3155060 RepID=UPI003442E8DB